MAHPALVAVAKEVFDQYMKEPNQIHNIPKLQAPVTQKELLQIPKGIKLISFKANYSVFIQKEQSL